MDAAEPQLPEHGGDAERIAHRYGLAADQLLDFSVNVNPLGAPEAVVRLLADRDALWRSLAQYPDREARILTNAVHERYGVRRDQIVVGNGSAALLDAALRAIAPSTCLVPVPAFSEYRRAVTAAGHVWEALPLNPDDDFALCERDVVHALRGLRPGTLILTNPHNPSGALSSHATLARIVEAAATTQSVVVLDEAFIDYAPGQSLLALAGSFENLIVLRSVTKFYAMPALRVGYAIASPVWARRMRAFLPSWPVTTLALEAAARAIQDPAFDERSIAYNAAQSRTLAQALRSVGIRVVPSAANFLLVELPPGWGSREAMCEQLIQSFGVLVRNCADYDGLEHRHFIRVAVKDADSNVRLVRALHALSRQSVVRHP